MRRLYYMPFVLLFLMQTGCTLTLDEYIMPEEERGVGEIYTQQEEFGTVSYQFKDSVLNVTDNIQEKYLVRVEHDSILYFSTDIPRDWRPYVGMKLASHITHTLPWGLNHKVIAVEDVGGFLKVTATKVSTDEVYEHLKFCFDAPVGTPDLSGLSEEELKDYGYELMVDPETGDSVIMDWNDYDVARGLRPAGAKRQSLKRYLARTRDGGEEKPSDADSVSQEMLKKGFSTTVLVDQFWDTRDLDGLEQLDGHMGLAWKGIVNQLRTSAAMAKAGMASSSMEAEPYIGIGVSYTKYEKVHIEEDKDKKYEYKYTETWGDITIKAEAGVSASASFKRNQGSKATYGNAEDMLDQMKELSRAGKLPKLMGNNGLKTSVKKSWDHIKIRFPLGVVCGIPIAAILGAQVTPIVEINGSMSVSVTYTTDRVRSVHKVEKGEVTDYKEIISEGHVSGGEAVGNASVKIGFAVRGYAGIEVGATVGVTIGINLEAYVEGELSINLMSVDTSAGSKGFQFGGISGSIGYKVFAYFDVQLFVAPLGIDIWSKQLWKSDNFDMAGSGYNLNIGPNVTNATSGVNFGYLMGDDVDDESGYVTATSWVGEMDVKHDLFMRKATYYPGMRIYFGPIKDNHWTYMYPLRSQIGDKENYGYETIPDMGDWPTVEENKSYSFLWSGNLKEMATKYKVDKIDEVHMMPIFYCYKDNYDPSDDFPWEAVAYIDEDQMILVDDVTTYQNVAEPYIYTVTTKQLSCKYIGKVHEADFVDQYGVSDEFGFDAYEYSFYVVVDVMGASRMKGWGLDVKMYDPYKKRLKNSHKIFKVDANRSGRYTFIFTFQTTWHGTKELRDADGNEVPNKLYYTVKPYWDDPRATNAVVYADDKESVGKHPIVADGFPEDDGPLIAKMYKQPDLYGNIGDFFTIDGAK
ncbi:MAG: hypothetical protein K5945_11225 [Bacteroidaceae bacterium]|nr:hypothetical protein [Bacteroidaceae bacterium]